MTSKHAFGDLTPCRAACGCAWLQVACAIRWSIRRSITWPHCILPALCTCLLVVLWLAGLLQDAWDLLAAGASWLWGAALWQPTLSFHGLTAVAVLVLCPWAAAREVLPVQLQVSCRLQEVHPAVDSWCTGCQLSHSSSNPAVPCTGPSPTQMVPNAQLVVPALAA